MKPRHIQKLLADAIVLHRAGRLVAANESYELILSVSPRHFDALHLAGVVAFQQGKAQEAEKKLARAHAIVPAEPMCSMRLALALSALGRQSDAESHLRRVLQHHPRLHEAWDNLGVVLQLQGHNGEAIACHRRAVAVNPNYAQGWCNLGLALVFAEGAVEALECQNRALAADPGFGRALHARAVALLHLHRIPEAVEAFGVAIARQPQDFETLSYRLLTLHYLDGISREDLFREHRMFDEAISRTEVAEVFEEIAPRAAPNRRLRLAFLSPDLRTHSVAFFLEPLLAHLDREEFEVVLYHDHFLTDAVSDRLRSRADLWRNFAGQSADAVAARICADAPDILVDLAGHSGLNRLPLFARRLAPVQVSYLGYPDTTGLAAMDFRFVDGITDPIGDSDSFCSESLVRFAPAAWSYLPPADAPAPLAPAGNAVTFGSCNNLAKLNDDTLSAWSRVLAGVPGARLALKAEGLEQVSVQTWLADRLTAVGISPGRTLCAGRTAGVAEHLAFYQKIDVALDTFPYHGTTTTCEALWMGVPVVSRVGDRHAARVGASLLTAIGRPEWLALTWDDYVRIAVKMGKAAPQQTEDRLALRRQMAASVLMDHAGQAVRFGAALRECWQRRAQTAVGEPPLRRAVA